MSRTRRLSRATLLFGIVVGSSLLPLHAQLITAELTGITNFITGHPSELGTGIELGAPLRFTFTYDSVMTPLSSSSGSAQYLAQGPGREATVEVGDFHASVPDVSLSIVSGAIFGSVVFSGRADLIQLRSLTTTGIKDTEINATLLYPVGTLLNHDPQLPPADPFYAQLYLQRIYPNNSALGAHVEALYFDGPLPPFPPPSSMTPVPESSLIGALSLLLLTSAAGIKLRAHRRENLIEATAG